MCLRSVIGSRLYLCSFECNYVVHMYKMVCIVVFVIAIADEVDLLFFFQLSVRLIL